MEQITIEKLLVEQKELLKQLEDINKKVISNDKVIKDLFEQVKYIMCFLSSQDEEEDEIDFDEDVLDVNPKKSKY